MCTAQNITITLAYFTPQITHVRKHNTDFLKFLLIILLKITEQVKDINIKVSNNHWQLNCFVFLAMDVCLLFLLSPYTKSPENISIKLILHWSQPKMTFGGIRDVPAWSMRLFLCFFATYVFWKLSLMLII